MVLKAVRRFLFPVRRGVERFFGVLDSEGVVFFQALVYVLLAWGGIYCLFIAQAPPDSLRSALGPQFDTVWLYLCVGVLWCLVGKCMSAKRTQRPVWVHNAGLWLQLAGDVSAFGAFAGYVVSTWQTSEWGRPVIAVWVMVALAECGFFLCWRDIRRIKQAESDVVR